MGTKYIIEVEDKPFELLSEDGFTSEKLFRVKGFNSLVFDWNGLNMLTPYTEPDTEQVRKEAYEKGFVAGHLKAEKSGQSFYEDGYQCGLNDAWECTRKIRGMTWDEQREVFGTDYYTDIIALPVSECIEKIRQYEQEKEEQIQAGDEVIIRNKTAVVTEITDRYVRIMYSDGSCYALFSKGIVKTGRHFPEIAEVLRKMRENNG